MLGYENRSSRFIPRAYGFHSCGPQCHALTPSGGAALRSNQDALTLHSATPPVVIPAQWTHLVGMEGWYSRIQGLQLSKTNDFSGPGSYIKFLPVWMLVTREEARFQPIFPTSCIQNVWCLQHQNLTTEFWWAPKISGNNLCCFGGSLGDFWPLWFAYAISSMVSCL